MAQWELGLTYANGNGVPVDFAVALSWYLKAADNGIAAAQWVVGKAYADGLLGAEETPLKPTIGTRLAPKAATAMLRRG